MSGMQMLETSQLAQHSEPAAEPERKGKKRRKGDIALAVLY